MYSARVGMPGDIRKRFLGDSIDDQLVLFREWQRRVEAPLDGNPRLFGK